MILCFYFVLAPLVRDASVEFHTKVMNNKFNYCVTPTCA